MTLQQSLFEQIRTRILKGFWVSDAKLPSTRMLATQLKISRNTVIQTYEQLVAEGYLNSKPNSGFYVALTLPEQYMATERVTTSTEFGSDNTPNNGLFAPGVAELAAFPMSTWNRLLQRHSSRSALLGNQDLQGLVDLREALHRYLTGSRSVVCQPDQIIITAGAQQSIAIALLATQKLKPHQRFLVEYPGYRQVVKVLDTFDIDYDFVDVHAESGIDLKRILDSKSTGIYLTPSNQYPMGSSIQTEQRLRLIEWAQAHQSWIIEDDYDSEFQFDSRPFRSMQGLAAESGNADKMIYIGSMSKVMFNSLRIGYMVVPQHVVPLCLEIKDALSGDTPALTQAALADFINEGVLLRHIRKMRRLYEQKYRLLKQCIEDAFGEEWLLVSQGAGLHVTVEWQSDVDEVALSDLAQANGLVVRPMRFYEPVAKQRHYGSVVLGFGNAPIEAIPEQIKRLATLYYSLR
ncbi:MocR-like pyridoxine biosynthesis transcription factor PdxR [Vibrio sp. 10N]|uniref:MocR-like pyridoxine biosynthesis transcription factor PdxR n=1 Tax=Vibrio sp. 10N TaxID=3058938 RepID=UPI002812B34F|nr:PLP-dependent aminotransferase family protein [Vibrio sp. 10N]